MFYAFCNLKESRLMRHFILIYNTAKRKVLSRDMWPTFYLGFANTIVSNYKRNSTERLLKNGGMFRGWATWLRLGENHWERSRARRWWPPPGTDDDGYGVIRFSWTPFIWDPLLSSTLITRIRTHTDKIISLRVRQNVHFYFLNATLAIYHIRW